MCITFSLSTDLCFYMVYVYRGNSNYNYCRVGCCHYYLLYIHADKENVSFVSFWNEWSKDLERYDSSLLAYMSLRVMWAFDITWHPPCLSTFHISIVSSDAIHPILQMWCLECNSCFCLANIRCTMMHSNSVQRFIIIKRQNFQIRHFYIK